MKHAWTFFMEWAWALWGGPPGDPSFYTFVGACCLVGLGLGATLAIKPWFGIGWRVFGALLFAFAGYGMWSLLQTVS